MKKKFLITFFIMLGGLLLLCGNSKAATYSNKFVSVVIPDKYEKYYEDTTDENTWLSFTNLNYGEYTDIHYDVDTKFVSRTEYTKAYLDQYVSNLEGYAKEYGETIKFYHKDFVEINGCKGVRVAYKIYEPDYAHSYYKDEYLLLTDNYEVELEFYTLNPNFINSTEEKNIVNSFKIKDTVLKSRGIPFTDVASNSWYLSAVKYVYNSDLIKGSNAYTFAPDTKLTRGMLVTILYRMDGSPKVSGTAKFPDVKSTDYYSTAIKWASDRNIVSGYNNGKFGPNDNITREQLAVILRKYAKYKGKNVSSLANISSYKDASKVSSYAKTEVQWAIASGIISGKNNGTKIDPQGSASRAEAAAMITSYCSKVK